MQFVSEREVTCSRTQTLYIYIYTYIFFFLPNEFDKVVLYASGQHSGDTTAEFQSLSIYSEKPARGVLSPSLLPLDLACGQGDSAVSQKYENLIFVKQ